MWGGHYCGQLELDVIDCFIDCLISQFVLVISRFLRIYRVYVMYIGLAATRRCYHYYIFIKLFLNGQQL